MNRKVLIAHADGEEHLAEKLVVPLQEAGYEVAYRGTVKVGESVVEEASKVLGLGGPVILCGTVKATGTGWAHWVVNSAAYSRDTVRVFPVQMEENAFLGWIGADTVIAKFWQDPAKAVEDLLAAMGHYYPLDETQIQAQCCDSAEKRYRNLLLDSCDIVNMGNLPEDRRIAQRELKLRLLYIPLRVWIESRREGGQEALLEEVEERRAASLRGTARIEKVGSNRRRVPVGERLAKARRLVILGDPGSGKTTLTRWIATAYLLRLKNDPDWKNLLDVKTLPDEDWLPIIVRCRDLDQKCYSGAIDEILGHVLRKNQLTVTEAEVLQAVLLERLQIGTALLILDGLDEIIDPVVRACFCQQLERIHIALPNAPIIVTSRIVGYREMGYRIGRGFEHVTLAELSCEEKDDFARRWCELTESPERRTKAAEELVHDIHSSDRIERMTGNPMLLTTMALVKRKVGKLPSRRADLYWEAVQVLLNWRGEVDKSLDSHEAIPQLEYVAYAMCDRGVQQLRRDEVLELITQMRADYPNVHEASNHTPEVFLHNLEARTALLVEAGQIRYLGRDAPVYEFRHLTFQEYLAALALVDGRFPGREAKRRLSEQVAALAGRTAESSFSESGTEEIAVTESWREALRLCTTVCSDDDVDSVMSAIFNPPDNESDTALRARAIMATMCVADEPNVSEALILDIFGAFASRINMDDGTGHLSTNADVAAMEVSGSRWAVKLREKLTEEFCRREILNRIDGGGPGGLCGMVGAASLPSDPFIKEKWLIEKADQLRMATEQEAIDVALTIMESAFERKICYEDSYKGINLIDALLFRLQGSAPMSHAAAWALCWLKESGWQLTKEQSERIVSFIGDINVDIEAFRYLTWNIDGTMFEDAIDPLIARINHEIPSVRYAVVLALGKIGSDRAIAPLIGRLDDTDIIIRREAVGALSRDLDEVDKKLLSQHLNGESPYLDPHKKISAKFVTRTAKKLNIKVEEVRVRYEALAERFHLQLAWRMLN